MFLGEALPFTDRAAARPAASPMAMQVDITRIAPIASWVAEMLRPATRSCSILRGTSDR